jgi:anti-sigma-K factor RskA
MHEHDQVKLLLAAVAACTATDEEFALVAGHVDSCAVCAEQLLEFHETAGMLLVQRVEAPPQLRARVLAAVAETARADAAAARAAARPRKFMRAQHLARPSMRYGFACVAACLALLLAVAGVHNARQMSPERQVSIEVAAGAPGSMKQVQIERSGSRVRVAGLPSVKAGRVWQLWSINARGATRSLGVLSASAHLAVPAGSRLLAITDEPAGGSAQPTSEPQLTAML